MSRSMMASFVNAQTIFLVTDVRLPLDTVSMITLVRMVQSVKIYLKVSEVKVLISFELCQGIVM